MGMNVFANVQNMLSSYSHNIKQNGIKQKGKKVLNQTAVKDVL